MRADRLPTRCVRYKYWLLHSMLFCHVKKIKWTPRETCPIENNVYSTPKVIMLHIETEKYKYKILDCA